MSALDKEFISTSWTLSVFPIMSNQRASSTIPPVYQFSNTTPHTFPLSLSPLFSKDPFLYYYYIATYHHVFYLSSISAKYVYRASSRARSNSARVAGNRYYYVRSGSRGGRSHHSPKRLAGPEHVGFSFERIQFNSIQPIQVDLSKPILPLFGDNWTESRKHHERRDSPLFQLVVGKKARKGGRSI